MPQGHQWEPGGGDHGAGGGRWALHRLQGHHTQDQEEEEERGDRRVLPGMVLVLYRLENLYIIALKVFYIYSISKIRAHWIISFLVRSLSSGLTCLPVVSCSILFVYIVCIYIKLRQLPTLQHTILCYYYYNSGISRYNQAIVELATDQRRS